MNIDDRSWMDRLTSEEVTEVRRRLLGERAPDLRAHGASTLDDVAEAMGLAPDVVRQELDRIRAERAMGSSIPARKGQRGLLVLAVVLLAAAYPIHLLNPRKLSAEEEAVQAEDRLAEIRARRKAHPVVHYPILTTVRSGVLPPAGFNVEFKGVLTDTKVASGSEGRPLPQEAARKALVEAMFHAYSVAREAERSAPRPDRPLPPAKEDAWRTDAKPGPTTLVYSVGTSGFANRTPIEIDSTNGLSSAQWNAEVRRRLTSSVDDLLGNMARGQEMSLKIDPPRGGNLAMPPAGYSVGFAGWQNISTGAPGFVVLPYDAPAVARKLVWTVRQFMWRDAEPSDLWTSETRAANAKKPPPAYAKVTLTGPGGEVAFRLPMTASPEYPNAAAAARAADRILAEGVRKAAAQVGPLDGEVIR